MSSDSQGTSETRAEMRRDLTRELQQLQGLGASFFRAAATRLGLTSTDIEVLESLAATGPTTAGQLAELTGLTTGAITGMLNRLEEAKLVRRERDPADGRRVIVQLATGTDAPREITALFESIRQGWDELTSHYDDAQVALLLDFLKRNNALFQQEIIRLRESPDSQEGVFSAPLGEFAVGKLVASGVARIALRANKGISELYQARFEGPLPDVKAKDRVVTIRYPRTLGMLSVMQSSRAEVTLNASIPWRITIKGGASDINAELGGLDLMELDVRGGMSIVRLELPVPSGVVPVRISGGASEIIVRRPTGVAARVHLKGWVSTFVFDDQIFSDMGSDVRLQSPNFDSAAPYYDIDVSSSASMVTIESD